LSTRIEVGVDTASSQVVLLVTVPGDDPGEAFVTRCPLSADECRELVNGMMEAVAYLSARTCHCCKQLLGDPHPVRPYLCRRCGESPDCMPGRCGRPDELPPDPQP
jgi:hypothetical protein